MSEPEPRPLSESLDAVVRDLRGGDGRSTATVFAQWEAAVGDHVAAHARPVSLDDGRLLVEVSDPAWATQLRFLESSVLERLTAVVGPGRITALDVRVRRT